MFFDPLSTWLVVLIADGINLAGEKLNGGMAAEYDDKTIKICNEQLNEYIRKVKKDYGLILAERAYEQIQLYIKIVRKNYSFQYAHGQIVIDLDNQEYIIALFEECAKKYSKYEDVEEYRQKAKEYNDAAIEARQRKEQCSKELEMIRVKEAKEREKEAKEQEKQRRASNIFLIVGLVIFFAFIVFFLS